MFTGIVECVGEILEVRSEGTNRHFRVDSPISGELQVDQSVSHEGVCLTVTKFDGNSHWVTAIEETLAKSNLGQWSEGTKVNLERCMTADGRFDGHIVQGHVDTTARLEEIIEKEGSWEFQFRVASTALVVEKGSICINGTSLTCYDVTDHTFRVAIIPYTYELTSIQHLKLGMQANVEFDILGKYVMKILSNQDRTTSQ